jgi:hypothetical protein
MYACAPVEQGIEKGVRAQDFLDITATIVVVITVAAMTSVWLDLKPRLVVAYGPLCTRPRVRV